MTQRPVRRSYSTSGSVTLPVAHVLVAPEKSADKRKGPATLAPVVLEKMTNDTFTVSTTCVLPTEALVSGGTLVTVYPVNPLPSQRMFRPSGVLSSRPQD